MRPERTVRPNLLDEAPSVLPDVDIGHDPVVAVPEIDAVEAQVEGQDALRLVSPDDPPRRVGSSGSLLNR